MKKGLYLYEEHRGGNNNLDEKLKENTLAYIKFRVDKLLLPSPGSGRSVLPSFFSYRELY